MKTTDYPKTLIDPVITEVRRHKQEIAEAFGFDVVALGRSLQRRENGDPRFKVPGGEAVVDNRLPAPSRSDPS
jgi:hypothetical protein